MRRVWPISRSASRWRCVHSHPSCELICLEQLSRPPENGSGKKSGLLVSGRTYSLGLSLNFSGVGDRVVVVMVETLAEMV